MGNPSAELHWSGRVPLHRVRRLYEGDARGLLDGELLDDTGDSGDTGDFSGRHATMPA